MREADSVLEEHELTACAALKLPYTTAVSAAMVYFSALSFLGFGGACIFLPAMKKEFVRYGVPQFRPLVGGLQIAGGLGLLAGFALPLLGQLAATGLAVLMFLGACLRRHIKDSFAKTLPALSYMMLNAYLAVAGY